MIVQNIYVGSLNDTEYESNQMRNDRIENRKIRDIIVIIDKHLTNSKNILNTH